MAAGKKPIDEHTGTETTGHEWDGIQELDTPLPRWWLGNFYACIVWAIGYWIFMPAWPMLNGYTHGLLNHCQRDEAMANVRRSRMLGPQGARTYECDTRSRSNPILICLQFALAEGKAAFGDNCAPCHGAGAQGSHGYPNLNDDIWIWGGKLEDIQHTITVGVRSTSPDTRQIANAFIRPRRYPEAW